MKLLEKLNLEEKEITLIKRVFVISLAVCLLAVIASVSLQFILTKKSTPDIAGDNGGKEDLASIFSKKKEGLLPIDVEAHKIAAELYRDDPDHQKAITHLLRILSVEKNNRKIKLDLSAAYLEAGEYAKAKALLSGLMEEESKDSLVVPIRARYGLALFYSGKIDESILLLDRLIEEEPTSAEAYCYRGQVEASLNLNSEKIEHFFKKSLDLKPRYTEALYQFARFYMNRPNPSDSNYFTARRLLLKQAAIQPLNPKVHSRLGMVYYYLKQSHLAENAYQTALHLNKNDYNTHYNLGELYFSQLGDTKKAIGEFKKTIQLKRNHVEANFKLGLISLKNNMAKEAVQYFKTARREEPENIRVLLQLGVAYEKLTMVREAVETYQSILEYDALNEVALQKLKLLKYGA